MNPVAADRVGTQAPEASMPAVFAALGDATRWDLVVRLGQAPASASALAAHLPISRQAIAQHLEVLRAVGVVDRRRRGREVEYRANAVVLERVAGELADLAAGWDRRLEALRRTAESPFVAPTPASTQSPGALR